MDTNTQKKLKRLEKRRLKLFKNMLEFEQKMNTCHRKDLGKMQREYQQTINELLNIEELIKNICPNITYQFDYMEETDYKRL